MLQRLLLSASGRELADSRLVRRWLGARAESQARKWKAEGERPPPPHLVKQRLLRALGQRLGATRFVETGTYLGDMVFALTEDFEALHSIELSGQFVVAARRRFRRRPHVTIHHGDSGRVLGQVLDEACGPGNERALIWLDGHWSGGTTARGDTDCPIWGELQHVAARREARHVVAIDDAHLFVGSDSYPTIGEIKRFVSAQLPSYEVELRDNAILLVPGSAVPGSA